MLFKHLNLQNAAELRQCFQVIHMNYQRPQHIIQIVAQSLQTCTVEKRGNVTSTKSKKMTHSKAGAVLVKK
jgi:hypothetical protein